MADIKATPSSNELMRILAETVGQVDAFARKPFGYDNPPAEVISDFLGIPAVQRTMERVAYGAPLTTGKGMTTRMRPDTEEALLASTGLLQPTGALARAAEQAAMKAGKAGARLAERVIPKIMERGGLPAELLQDLTQGSTSNMLRRGGRQDLIASHSGRMEDLLQGAKKKLVPELTHMSAAIQKGEVAAPWGDTTFIVRPNALDPATSSSIIHSRDAFTPLSAASNTRMFALPQYANRADLQTLAKKLEGRWDDRWTAYNVRGGENAVPGGDIVANNRFNSYRGFERSPYGADNLGSTKNPSTRAYELLDDLKRHAENENFYALAEDEFAEMLTVPDVWREILRNKQSIEDFSPAEQHKLFQELRNAPRDYAELKVFGNIPVNRDTFSGALVRKFPSTTGNKAQVEHNEVYQQLLSDLAKRNIPVLERTGDPIEDFKRAVQLQEQGFAEGGPVTADISDQQIRDYYAQHKGDANLGEQAFNAMRDTGLTRERIDAALTPESLAGESSYGGGDDFTPYDPEAARGRLWQSVSQAQHTAGNRMSRDDFLKKYGTTFVADDKGGNAASEVAGRDVAEYYDKYLAQGAKGDMDRGSFDSPNPDGTYKMPDFGGGKYRDAHPYFDGWDNVNPHPQSQLGNGWDEAWKNVGRPVATAAAMYFGAGAMGGMLGGAGAGAAGAGAAGASGTASGLAGTMGMAPGMAATALNTGALNTGMGLLRGQNIGDALRGGATSALLSPIGSMANTAATSAFSGSSLSPELLKALGTTVGSAATGGAQAVASGKPLGRGFIDGAVNGLVASAGNYIGGKTTGLTGNKFAGTAANTFTQSALRGKPLSIDALATQYAAGKITDLSGLDPSVASIVVNLAKRKRPSATGALSALAKYSQKPKI